jgi:hypothetical protein
MTEPTGYLDSRYWKYDPMTGEPISAASLRPWKEPSSAEIKALWNATKKPSEFARLLLAKVKEINT